MTYSLDEDAGFKAISQDIELTNGLLRDAWVQYKGQQWYPVLVKDQRTGIRGFEINSSGQWGKNEKVGKNKVGFRELLMMLANGSISSSAIIRCKRLNDHQRNGRYVSALEFSERIANVLAHLRTEAESKELGAITSFLPTPGDRQSASPPTVDQQIKLADDTPVVADDSGERKGTGYESDPAIRSAVEKYAVRTARRFYERLGYAIEEKGKPYDLLCKKAKVTIHVEVKGSRTVLDAIIVTINEVKDARDPEWRSDLFLVDNILVEPDGQGYKASGGSSRLEQGWVPDDNDLTPTQYRYNLPPIPVAE